ncbi:1,3-beta-galactosyl-N-acetylhexosamine phosphorylase [Vallitalea maricola]|uniref:1,3-beta-galactosyl-N-acetylhexosamine phosphorylase n=1 Tax=Vallitalea maricola TaxID=3074433 RepID=A0ACB5UGE3_9FIRM|nr:1,3-beta-galactosyl-N-acetylhexosamine phosphorylase [Vallitalea sp. AN17-2]
MKRKGQVTLPTDMDIIQETKEIVDRLGVDAIRDCDGTQMPETLKHLPVKIYSTYYTTRKDNEWAMKNRDEIQQVYLMTRFYTAMNEDSLFIPLMSEFYSEQLKPNSYDDIRKWWEVVDRVTGERLDPDKWLYHEDTMTVEIKKPEPFHDYTVSFLAYIMWDPVHMYNFIVNSWENVEHQIGYDVRQPKTQKYVLEKLRRWLEANPGTDVVRFTTFFHQFTLVFNEKGKEKFVDWFGYSASVSPYILEQFEKEVGYTFRPEFIIDKGYHNNTFRMPSKEFRDFMNFQMREVAKLTKKFVDLCHEYGKEAMMFLGDHWIGTEPFGPYFKEIGLDAVVGSVGNGTTLRLISDIPGVKYTEGRFLPYFFPDVFNENGNPLKEAKENWVTARRAILRKPLDRIGYGGYLKLAYEQEGFIDYIEKVCDEFRMLYDNIGSEKPYSHMTVGILNAWGQVRSWGTHMVAHAIDYKQTYSYAGILESLSGMPFDVKFLSFEEVMDSYEVLEQCDVIINIGDAYTATSGGNVWDNPMLIEHIKRFVAEGKGFIGVGEPTASEHQGRYFQMANVLGVNKEVGFSLSTDKYNWDIHDHFITKGFSKISFGEEIKNIYALDGARILAMEKHNVQMAVNEFGNGRSVYFSGLPYSFENSRLFYKAIFWAASKENRIKCWFSENYNIEVNYYPGTGKYCLVNNTDILQETVIYDGRGHKEELALKGNEIMWKHYERNCSDNLTV